jgi:anti-sigma factor RsiW
MTQNQCVNPREVEEGDLITYLHGEASPQVAEHIARCPFCSEQVEQLRMVDVQLLAAFYRESCPTPEVLADFALNRLSPTEKLRVAAHVRDCADCTEEISSVRDLTDEEPPSLLARLRESLALALIASPVVHMTAPARGQGWQSRFEVDDLIITLSSQAGGLTGRVRRRNGSPDADYSGQAWLLSPETDAATDIPRSDVDGRGHFQFSGPTAGSYALLLQIGKQDIGLEAIEAEQADGSHFGSHYEPADRD